MASNQYHFVTRWRVEGTAQEIYKLLSRATDLPRWWPSVYLEVSEIAPGDEAGVGKVVKLHTRGRLPYTLRWQFRVTEACYPFGYSLEAWGDVVGRGKWKFTQDGPWVDIAFDWNIRANKPLLRYLSAIFKPIFAANHRWAMAEGEKSIREELARRRAA